MPKVLIIMDVPENLFKGLTLPEDKLSKDGNLVLPMAIDSDIKTSFLYSAIAQARLDSVVKEHFAEKLNHPAQ